MAINVDNFESKPIRTGLPTIKVIGLGGGGGNVVNCMIRENIGGVQYIAVNTDGVALKSSAADVVIPIGTNITKGLGAGMRPEIGRASAEEDIEAIRSALEDTDLLFLAAGMGGGTGTGSIPVVAEVAREENILTIAVVTTPFTFEGKKRMRLAIEGIEELKHHVDTMMVIPNSKLLELASSKTTMSQAFAMTDDVLKQAISGITNLINLEGMINLDFADLFTVMSKKGAALMGTGVGKGQDRGLTAVQEAVNSPLISRPIDGATGVIINIVADEEFPLLDAEAAAEHIQRVANQDADVIFGLVYDPKLKDEVLVTVIATGYDPDFRPDSSDTIHRARLRVSDSLRHQHLSRQDTPVQVKRSPSSNSSPRTEELDIPQFLKQS